MYSDYFQMEIPSFQEVYTLNTKDENPLYFRVKVSQIEGVNYFQVSNLQPQELSRQIINNTPYRLEISTKNHKIEKPQVIAPGVTHPFAQCYPSEGKIIMLKILKGQGETPVYLEVDQLKITTDPEYYELGEKDRLVRMTIKFIGAHKVIEVGIRERKHLLEERLNPMEKHTEMRINIAKIGLDVIKIRNLERVELFYLQITNLNMAIEVSNGANIIVVGQIENMELDNNSSKSTNYPIVVSKRNAKTPKEKEEQKLFMNWVINVVNPLESSHLYFREIALIFSKGELFLEEEYLDEVLEFAGMVSSAYKHGEIVEEIQFIRKKYYDEFSKDEVMDPGKKVWQNTAIEKSNNFVYIESFKVSMLKFYITYYQDAGKTMDKDFEMFSLIGVVIGGIEEASIKITGIQKE